MVVDGTLAIYDSIGGSGFVSAMSPDTFAVGDRFEAAGITRSHGASRKFCFAPMYLSVVEILACPRVIDSCSIAAWFSNAMRANDRLKSCGLTDGSTSGTC